MIKPKILKGFRDFLPKNELQRKRLIRTLEDSFMQSGFVPIDTPALEYTEVLLGKGGGETDKQIYRFMDNGKRDVSLRFDLTVPFARYVAMNRNKLYLPFKRYHIDKVWRGENTQKGRYREFTQCDFDIVGVDSTSADFEILLTMYQSLKAINVNNFKIHLSHRALFNLFLEKRNILQYSTDILRAVDKLNKIGEEAVLEILKEITESKIAEEILYYIAMESSDDLTLQKMETLSGGTSEASERLKTILSTLKKLGISDHFILDPSITRGLDYYTGVVYETFLTDLPGIGSVCSGGRYNNLAGLYTKENLPGVGSSIGLDRLMAALEELNTNDKKKASTKVIILMQSEHLLSHYHKLAMELRKAGISCEVYPSSKKLGVQFNYAEAKEIPYAIICGEEEKMKDAVNLKDLKSRENHNMISLLDAITLME